MLQQMKIKILILSLIIVFILWTIFFLNKEKSQWFSEQKMLEQTYNISKDYVALRYKTDNVLINSKDYSDYESWNKDMWAIILWWEQLEKEALALENLAWKISQEDLSFNIITKSQAYNKQEISDVFDKAPAWKKIKTLAKFLWVDAQKAFKILKQDQAQVEADAWNEAGNTFQKLETSATVIKDGCKVAWFVGWIILTGWTSTLAAWSTLAKAAVIISWADLTLEVTDDAAKIALWNHNKISAIIWDWRKVTEPLSTILSISSIPWNLASKYEKFSAVMTWLDQFNSAAQDGKIIGIELPVYTKEKTKAPIKTVILQKEELQKWLQEIKKEENNDIISKEEIEEILLNLSEEIKNEKELENKEEVENNEKTEVKDEKKAYTNNTQGVLWVWEWVMKYTPSGNASEIETNISLLLNKDGTVITTSEVDWFISWEQEWNTIKFYAESGHKDWWYVFNLSWDTMTLVKVEWPDQEDPTKWVEILAGGDFFWGKFFEITLKKQ